MVPGRSSRLEMAYKGEHTKDNPLDGIISTVLQWTKEAIGATLEGKNKALSWILQKCIPENLATPKKTWLGKWWRFISKNIIRRAVVTANNLVDTVWVAAISTADIINHTQGEIHDLFTGKDTSKAFSSVLHGIKDVVWDRFAKESVRNGLVRNEVGSTNFAGTTQRSYTNKAPTPSRTPVTP